MSACLIVISIVVPAGTKTCEEWQKLQIAELKQRRRAKGNHPADTPQLPLAILAAIALFGCCEKTLLFIPLGEAPSTIGQWGP